MSSIVDNQLKITIYLFQCFRYVPCMRVKYIYYCCFSVNFMSFYIVYNVCYTCFVHVVKYIAVMLC